MKSRLLVITMCVLLSVTPLMLAFPVCAADATTSVTITKLANDGTTILDHVTVTVEQMMSGSPELPIYGDGVTHYYFQGPTFDMNNMWDSGIPPEPAPGETVNVDSRDYGAVKGNDVKDLCEMLPNGGASPGDVIKIKAIDGFSKSFDYENVYSPQPRQGKMIISWYTKDAGDGLTGERYVSDGSYNTGMRLIFLAETLSPQSKHVFGHWDMHETLAQSRWHYYYDGTMWPSSSGLSVKWVSDIIIYSSEAPPAASWPLTLTGAHTYLMDEEEFEIGASCHEAVWVDGSNTWSGISLWRLVGYVDDDVQHGEGAFNDKRAEVGYEVSVIAFDSYTQTFASADVARNDNIIVANELNGSELPVDSYPLCLVGPGLTNEQRVSNIVEIELVSLPRGDASASLNVTTKVIMEMVGIALDRDSIDYGTLQPGENSAVVTVVITNIGTLNCSVTLEVNGADATAQDFYEQSLYIDGVLYSIDAIIAFIEAGLSQDVDTQVKVPLSWTEGTGAQNATFIFWAEAS